MCGGELSLPDGVSSGSCPYCGTLTTFPKLSSDQLEQLYNRAEHFRRINEYDKAVAAYEKIVEVNPDDPEAYWGLVISKFGIEYVEDPVSRERIPTCHRAQYESILADHNYLAALEKAGSSEKAIYESEAKRIAEIQKGILAISSNETPFDVFICYKESDNYGRRTKDSVTAQEIYYQLTNAGYKVFFARITLENKLGQQYEPYIFAALNSAKVMLVIGSQKDYFDAVWVRNEWSRFLALMKKDKSKLLIPCYRDMDAYDIPEALSLFQAQDMGKIGFIQDLLHGIKKVFEKKTEAEPVTPSFPAAATEISNNTDLLLRRAKVFLRTDDFTSAQKCCTEVLDNEPENAWAHFYSLMAKNEACNETELEEIANIAQDKQFLLAKEFADNELTETLERITQGARRKAEEEQRKAEEEQRQKDENSRLRSEVEERYGRLSSYFSAETKLNGDANILRELKQCRDDEKHLLNTVDLLTEEIVSPVQARSEALISSLPDIKILQAAVRRRNRKRFFIVSGIISVIIIAVSFYFAFPYMRGYKLSWDGTVLVEVIGKDITEFTIPDGVTVIEYRAFAGCTSLTSVTIPDSVTNIGVHAFSGCSSLESITIPDSVTSIGEFAFYDCSSLESITIPNSVTEIGEDAFSGCDKLTSVTADPKWLSKLPEKQLTSFTVADGVTSIGNWAFYGCSSLTSITIPDSVTSIGDRAFSGCSSLTSVTIPDSVTSIGDRAFFGCSSLTNITIPVGVTSIGDRVFCECSSLTSVTIPDSVTSIGDRAFPGCTNLTSITIPDSVTSIGHNAFSGCSSLESITIPDSVTSIGELAFYDCSSLTSVTIPDSVTSIGDWTFCRCSSLKSVTIPNSVTSIGVIAFSGCSSLESVTIPDSVTNIGGSAFSGCSSLESVTIPDSVTSIGDGAFSRCSSLKSVTIPDSVTYIRGWAFSGCSSLESVTIPDSVTRIGNKAFWGCYSLKSVTIPRNCEVAYDAFPYSGCKVIRR